MTSPVTSGSDHPEILNLVDLREKARGFVSPQAFDYVAGGSGDERTRSANELGFRDWRLVHRVLRDVENVDASVTLLDQDLDQPVLVAPTAFHKLMHPNGEAATAEGAHAASTLMCASTLSTTSLEAIAEASPGPKWFQLYVYRDRDLTRDLVERAEAAGYEALVLTVDSPVWGRRERDIENGFSLPPDLSLANFPDLDQGALPEPEGGGKPEAGGSARRGSKGGTGDALAAYVEEQLDPSLTWEDLRWLVDETDLPVIVKGIVHPEDARLAVDHGAAGVVVSNHGGRQLDAGVATVDALPSVAEEVGGDVPVLVDGGVRRGTDVVTAMALGASAVLVGRPVLWGLALGGAAGVERVLTLLRDEVRNAMALAGARSWDDVGPGMLRRPGSTV